MSDTILGRRCSGAFPGQVKAAIDAYLAMVAKQEGGSLGYRGNVAAMQAFGSWIAHQDAEHPQLVALAALQPGLSKPYEPGSVQMRVFSMVGTTGGVFATPEQVLSELVLAAIEDHKARELAQTGQTQDEVARLRKEIRRLEQDVERLRKAEERGEQAKARAFNFEHENTGLRREVEFWKARVPEQVDPAAAIAEAAKTVPATYGPPKKTLKKRQPAAAS